MRTPTSDRVLPPRRSLEPEVAAREAKEQIILLDDNALVRALCTARLEAEGFSTHAIASPFELATTLQTYAPDAALIDVSMPALKGHELVQFLRKRSACPAQDCLLILYSDLPNSELARLAELSGADAFISKAPGLDYLIHRLSQLLELRTERNVVCQP